MRAGAVRYEDPTAEEPLAYVDVEMSQRYRHAFGSASAFYAGLDRGALTATRCSTCGASWFPPRRFCDDDLAPTEPYDLPGTGTVAAATRVHVAPPFGGIDVPYVLATIRLDGVAGGVTHRVLTPDPPPTGTRVRAHVLDQPVAHPLLRVAFAVEEPTP